MRGEDRRQSPEENSLATVKRKHVYFEQFHHNNLTKKQKCLSSETETCSQMGFLFQGLF
ncbi:hypothetical protein CCACVL1_01195 [Corchorus capsularis]|uniref:Uncharacterized protein n=1 Tax=Corchorus capsularis TaxID=210143 RepID=A0A1R3KLF9_COCAP|nr:hypothetical protein CCACVL1_01195 [Corchorus capsularis]